MGDAGAGRHDLDIASLNQVDIAQVILVAQRAAQGHRNDFHVVVVVAGKAFTRCHDVVVDHPQLAEAHALGVVIVREREGMPGVQPAMVGNSAGFRIVENFLHRRVLFIFPKSALLSMTQFLTLTHMPVFLH